MPITAKLSRSFYDKLGDDATKDLVDWFNAVDLEFRTELRTQLELNFARFDAKLEQRFAEFETRMIRWMFTLWTGTAVALAALVFGVLRTH